MLVSKIDVLGLVGLLSATTGCALLDEVDDKTDVTAKFDSLERMLADPIVQQAIEALPEGDDVSAGDYYDGDTPVDISGTWTTSCCGGRKGSWLNGDPFGGVITFEALGRHRVDVPQIEGAASRGDATGSFVVGKGNNVTVFLQVSAVCKNSGERVRVVAVDRFVVERTVLTQYVRSFAVIGREKKQGPWDCYARPVGTGDVSTEAVFGESR
jgi:hypothetical protein